MARWKDPHSLSKSAKRLIFGTEKPSQAQVALYTLTQYDTPTLKEAQEKAKPLGSKRHPALPGSNR